jgi:hypothetical protein
MARKKTGNEPEAGEPRTFGNWIIFHMERGTRPGGMPDVEGRPWKVSELAAKFGVDDRNVRNWRAGKPTKVLHAIQQAFFNGEPQHADWSNKLAIAHRLAKGVDGGVEVPQLNIHNPGLCLGRGDEVARVVANLLTAKRGGSCLVLGDAGHGKTTLTEKVGVHPEIVARYGSRRWIVELERADSAGSALAEIAEVIGLERAAPLVSIRSRLAAKPCLMILDNLETPLHADGRATEALLRDLVAVPEVALIASLRSRETVAGVEWTDQLWLEPLKSDVARKMFVSIARNIREDDPALGYFLNELDGIPLAIRLVAKRASTRRTLSDLRREWEDKGALLAEDPGGEGSRRDSLVGSIEFSLASRRLHSEGKQLFALLGQLPAGLSLNDLDVLLEDVGDDAADKLRQVGLLKDSPGRIGLLAPIRDVARRRHRPTDAAMIAWRRHFLCLVRREGGANWQGRRECRHCASRS